MSGCGRLIAESMWLLAPDDMDKDKDKDRKMTENTCFL
jgi:hypothetical protein